jgi:perosamine synthetase
MGQKTMYFETAFSTFLGNNAQCLAVSNGTAALYVVLLSYSIKHGDEVIAPALMFIADQNVTRFSDMSNVLVDITSLEDWSVDPQEIKKRITSKPKAAMIVYYADCVCDMDGIIDVCWRYNR